MPGHGRGAYVFLGSEAEVDAVLRVNVLGSWLVTRALANKFRPAGGAIVNLTSVLAELEA